MGIGVPKKPSQAFRITEQHQVCDPAFQVTSTATQAAAELVRHIVLHLVTFLPPPLVSMAPSSALANLSFYRLDSLHGTQPWPAVCPSVCPSVCLLTVQAALLPSLIGPPWMTVL